MFITCFHRPGNAQWKREPIGPVRRRDPRRLGHLPAHPGPHLAPLRLHQTHHAHTKPKHRSCRGCGGGRARRPGGAQRGARTVPVHHEIPGGAAVRAGSGDCAKRGRRVCCWIIAQFGVSLNETLGGVVFFVRTVKRSEKCCLQKIVAFHHRIFWEMLFNITDTLFRRIKFCVFTVLYDVCVSCAVLVGGSGVC